MVMLESVDLPGELLEVILSLTDGCTLLRARRVSVLWKLAADHLLRGHDQLAICLRREAHPLTLLLLTGLSGLRTSQHVHRVWGRHMRLSDWPVTLHQNTWRLTTSRAPFDVLSVRLIAVVQNREVVVMARDGWRFVVPNSKTMFVITEVLISSCLRSTPAARLLVIGYDRLVNVMALWCDASSMSCTRPVSLDLRNRGRRVIVMSDTFVCVSYPREVRLFRVDVSARSVVPVLLYVASFSSVALIQPSLVGPCLLLALFTTDGRIVWHHHASDRFISGTKPTRQRISLPSRDSAVCRHAVSWPVRVDAGDILALSTFGVGLVVSLGAVVLLVRRGLQCRQWDAFEALQTRVTACCLHGRLLSMGTETGCVVVYSFLQEDGLLDPHCWTRLCHVQVSQSTIYRLGVVEEATRVRLLAADSQTELHEIVWQQAVSADRLLRYPLEIYTSQTSHGAVSCK